MGNYIKTRNGVDISLDIPAQITSFNSVEENSHVSRGKLKVFSIGKTGDIRVFTKEFADTLVASLPGTPVVAHFEDDDFIGHDDVQYVYGYVPEDAIPEWIEENGKTFAVVDVNLFTERNDNIGEVARKIIGKAQSLELNPDTVDWELVYMNGKLEKIVFKKGSFYGLSVLGDKQKPAFEGAGFFTENVIEQLKEFQQVKIGGTDDEMNKKEVFTSLGISDKADFFNKVIQENFEDAWLHDFTEELVVARVYADGVLKYYAAPYTWDGETNYTVGAFEEVLPDYSKMSKEETSPEFTNDQNEVQESVSEDSQEFECPACGDDDKDDDDDKEKDGCDKEKCEETEDMACGDKKKDEQDMACGDKKKQCEDEEDMACGDKKKECAAEINETESQDGKLEMSVVDETSKEEEFQEKESLSSKDNTADVAALSCEERDELNELRREKKLSLIDSFAEFLNKETIDSFKERVDNYDFNSLEIELKLKSFDLNKKKINQSEENSTQSVIMPIFDKKAGMNDLDRIISENL